MTNIVDNQHETIEKLQPEFMAESGKMETYLFSVYVENNFLYENGKLLKDTSTLKHYLNNMKYFKGCCDYIIRNKDKNTEHAVSHAQNILSLCDGSIRKIEKHLKDYQLSLYLEEQLKVKKINEKSLNTVNIESK